MVCVARAPPGPVATASARAPRRSGSVVARALVAEACSLATAVHQLLRQANSRSFAAALTS